jgi:DNA end-binding protein Ku
LAAIIWKGTITFGLVSIPVKLSTATSSHDISFKLLHKDCKQPIHYQYYCPACNRVVDRSELVRGYEFEKGKYVVVDDDEFQSIQPESRTDLEILEFIEVSDVDPIYFEKTYYLAPDDKATKSFDLFAEALKKSGRAGIGRLIMRNHEYLVAVRFAMDTLLLHTMLYQDEIREKSYSVSGKKLPEKEVQLAEQLIGNLTDAFRPEKFKNEYVGKLKKMLENKARGRKLTIVPPKAKPKTVDLLEALQKSVQQTKKSMARDESPKRARLRKIK